jgi:putative pyruvate formate lyase activating enzyme
MSQYFPAHRAAGISGIDRPLTEEEYDEAVAALEEEGFENGWVQELEAQRGQV